MGVYLLGLAIGPVQGFVAAARRTRDLWYGSYLLSELAKAAARAVQSLDPTSALIFPSLDSFAEGSGQQVSNKILARIDCADPGAFLESVKDAVCQEWRTKAKSVFEKLKRELDQEIWDAQVVDVVEMAGAWVALPCDDDYPARYERLEKLLAARKCTRDFQASTFTRGGIEKSSLDGARESVLKRVGRDPAALRRWGIGEREELDCPGLVKRVAGKLEMRQGSELDEHFTPLPRIAIDPWVRGIAAREKAPDCKPLLDRLANSPEDLVSRVKGNGGCYEALPYDGQLLYPFRLAAKIAEYETDKDVSLLLKDLKRHVDGLCREHGEPQPYLAILMADGDEIGKAVSASGSIEAHQQLSDQLAKFSAEAPNIFRSHQGHLVYAAGDEVRGFVPVDRVLDCARALHETFGEEVANKTLSVGIAIGHFLEPLGSLLDRARRAEREAKGKSRDGFCLLLKPRSGAEIAIRSDWRDDPDASLQRWIWAFRDRSLPARTPYLISRLAGILTDPAGAEPSKKDLVDSLLRTLLQRRSASDEPKAMELQRALLDRWKVLSNSETLERFGRELLIARCLARSYVASGPESEAR